MKCIGYLYLVFEVQIGRLLNKVFTNLMFGIRLLACFFWYNRKKDREVVLQ